MPILKSDRCLFSFNKWTFPFSAPFSFSLVPLFHIFNSIQFNLLFHKKSHTIYIHWELCWIILHPIKPMAWEKWVDPWSVPLFRCDKCPLFTSDNYPFNNDTFPSSLIIIWNLSLFHKCPFSLLINAPIKIWWVPLFRRQMPTSHSHKCLFQPWWVPLFRCKKCPIFTSYNNPLYFSSHH